VQLTGIQVDLIAICGDLSASAYRRYNALWPETRYSDDPGLISTRQRRIPLEINSRFLAPEFQ
jgi:hypothetical protein